MQICASFLYSDTKEFYVQVIGGNRVYIWFVLKDVEGVCSF